MIRLFYLQAKKNRTYSLWKNDDIYEFQKNVFRKKKLNCKKTKIQFLHFSFIIFNDF